MRDAPDSVMLFAAGFGTRMGALTQDAPKPLIPVAGKALIDHALEHVQDYGPATIVANTHYLPDQIECHLRGTDVQLSPEAPDILETGGGLRAALPLLGAEPVFTMNTDAIWQGPNPLSLLAQHWRPEEMDALLLCIPPEQAVGHSGNGDFLMGADGRATRGPGYIYSGLQILRTDGLMDIPDKRFSLNVLWDRMLKAGRLFACAYPGKWCDVGKPDSIALAEALLGDGDV